MADQKKWPALSSKPDSIYPLVIHLIHSFDFILGRASCLHNINGHYGLVGIVVFVKGWTCWPWRSFPTLMTPWFCDFVNNTSTKAQKKKSKNWFYFLVVFCLSFVLEPQLGFWFLACQWEQNLNFYWHIVMDPMGTGNWILEPGR